MKTYPLKPQQKPLEFILPGKHTFYRSKAFFKDCLIIKALPPPFGFFAISRILFNVRDYTSIENLLPIFSTIISRIKADNTSFESFSKTETIRNAGILRKTEGYRPISFLLNFLAWCARSCREGQSRLQASKRVIAHKEINMACNTL